MSSVTEDILIRVKSSFDGSGLDTARGKFNTLKAGVGVALSAMGAQMLGFTETCVNSAIQAEAGWNSYTSALARVGGTAGRSIGEIKSEVRGLADTLGRSTGDIRQAETDFMNYGVSVQEAMKGASAVSALAAAKNMDYASSEQTIMSALKGRGMQLKVLGIDIKDYKDATSGAIDTTRLFNDILAKYGSSQAAYSKSALANQQRLNNSLASFKTAVGTALVPILEAVTPLIVQFANALANNKGLTTFVALSMSVVGVLSLLSGPIALIESLTGATWLLTAAQTALNIVMSLNPYVLIAMAIIALIAVIVIAYYKVDWFRNGVNALGQKLLEIGQIIYNVFASIPGIISSMIGGAIASATAVGQGIYNGVMNFVNGIISGIRNAFSRIASAIAGFAGSVYNAAKRIGVSIWNGIKAGAGAVGNWISSVLGGAGGPEAGLTYNRNITTPSNPPVNRNTTHNKTIIANMTFDTRNLTTYEAKQVVIGALEDL